LLLRESRPAGIAKLPTSFRSVQYADLFGWWHSAEGRAAADHADVAVGSLDTGSGIGEAPPIAVPDRQGRDDVDVRGDAQFWPASLAEVEMQHLGRGRPTRGGTSGSNSEGAFEPLRMSPIADSYSNDIPWRYFMHVGIGVIVLWVSVFGWIVCYGSYEYHDPTLDDEESTWLPSNMEAQAAPLSPQGGIVRTRSYTLGGRPLLAERLAVAWPHRFFQPTALACAGTTVFLGERFAVHAATLPPIFASAPHVQGFVPAVFSVDVSAPWGALSALESGERLLLVDDSGTAVMERVRRMNNTTTNTVVTRRWRIGQSANFKLRAIASVEGDAVADVCAPLGIARPQWALYGTTELGEVVSLCPSDDRLEPVRVVSKQLDENMELIGVAVDLEGALWWLAQSNGRAELRASTVDGVALGAWQLPSGRSWACGLCASGRGNGLLVAVAAGKGEAADPELWHVKSSMHSAAGVSESDAR